MTAVDYLSHNFNEFDLHQCWRNATKNKDSLINGRRLENASWRKFFQMKFALKTISPVTLNWNKDGDVNWLYGPFHTYEPLLQLQAAYKAAQNIQSAPVCGTADCLGCAVCAAHQQQQQHQSHLKPALKNFTNSTNPAAPVANPNNIRDLFLAGITRASSDPDLFSSSMQQQQAQGSNAPRNLDFGATKMSIRSNFERQAAIAPLTGKKADFFLASAAERERRSAAQDKARLAVTDRSGSEAESMDSFASSNVTSSPAATKTLRFAEEIPATALAAPSRTKVISFGIDDDEDDDDDDGEQAGAVASEVILASRKAEFASALSDDESDLLVSQVPRNRDLDTDDEESESDDDGNFGINIRSTTTGLGSKGIQVMANAGATSSFSHSSSIGLQRTPSAEKGLSKLSNLSSAIANNPSTSSGSSALGGLQRTSSFEKGLSKLSALSKP